ncbi:MAG: hypothetical protein OEO77_11040 [Acidimicrobiia bacterium]|nr:hypothetical protein [Acidimicrobiia bacterium]
MADDLFTALDRVNRNIDADGRIRRSRGRDLCSREGIRGAIA